MPSPASLTSPVHYGRSRSGLLLLALCLCFTAAGQQLSLTLRQAPFEEALRLVEAQSALRFVYTREELKDARPVTLEVLGASPDSVLRLLFKGQPLTYSRLDQFIVIKKIPSAATSRTRISGIVQDEEGAPIAGASIRIKGSNRGTVADRNGRFVLARANGETTLLVSAVGYGEKATPARDSLTLTLQRMVSVLDETVVIGYGYTTRRKAVGSVSRVAGHALSTASSPAHPLLALQGRATGVQLTQGSGLPGAPLRLRIRGEHSLQSGGDPLYLVDGIPFLLEGVALSQRSGLQALAPFHPIHSSDIESIEVLKDGAATAIYGSRGASGVVLITTRKPGDGPRGSLQVRRGWSRVGRTPDYLSTSDYLALRREAFQNDGEVPTPDKAPDLILWPGTRDRRWKELLIGRVAPSLEGYGRYSGGKGSTNFSLSGTWGREGTVFPGSLHSTCAHLLGRAAHRAIGDRLQAGLSLGYSGARYELPPQDLTASLSLPPNLYAPYDRQGVLQWEEGGYRAGNPLAVLHQPFTATLRQFTLATTVSYTPLPGLRLQSLWGGHRMLFSEQLLVPIAAQDPAASPKGSATYGTQRGTTWVWEPSVEYRLPLGSKTVGTLLGGVTLQETRRDRELLTGYGYRDDVLLGSLADAPQLSAGSSATRYRYSGVYIRFSGEHRSRYLLQATVRRDGSSRFGPGRQFARFGAVGGGWIFSRAKWVRCLLPGLSFGKLRLSYGTTGNDRIGDHRFGDAWRQAPYPYGGGSSWQVSRLYNPDFGWEATRKWEAALEGGFLQERLLFSAALYRNRSGNLIIRYALPAQTGFTTVMQNFPGVVENQGIELEASFRSRPAATLTWQAQLQLTLPQNRLLRFPGLEKTEYATTYFIGKPVNSLGGYEYAGVDPQTGLYRFRDKNDDGVLDKEDRGYVGTTDPRLYGGLSGELNWKGWTFAAHLYFVRQEGLHPVYASGVAPGDLRNHPRAVMDRWQAAGDERPFQRATQDMRSEAYFPATFQVAHSSAVLTDASFVRLNSAYLSYSRKREKDKKGLKGWECFLEGRNLFTLTRYAGGDPEVQSLTTLPLLRSLETGILFHF